MPHAVADEKVDLDVAIIGAGTVTQFIAMGQ